MTIRAPETHLLLPNIAEALGFFLSDEIHDVVIQFKQSI